MGRKCKECGAALVWLETKATPTKPSRWIPLDPPVLAISPCSHGLYTIVDSKGQTHRGNLASDLHVGGAVVGRVPHHSTCPYAHKFRRKHVKASKKAKKTTSNKQGRLF